MDSCIISTSTALQTRSCGASLAGSLYGSGITIFLSGELGAGKTTFLQGLGDALGIEDWMASPTYALEQRYQTPKGELLHLDLYRLNPADARALLASSDDHAGIRCIEWPEKLETQEHERAGVHVEIEEISKEKRSIRTHFHDTPLPDQRMVDQWRRDACIPGHIIQHCETVAGLAVTLAQALIDRGTIVRTKTLKKAGEVHDLFRFVDFKPGAGPTTEADSPKALACWNQWKARYPNLRHEAVCAQFLREQGFFVLGDIVEPHGLVAPGLPRTTVEQKLLFYADKRVQEDRVVSVEQRFDDFAKRYGNGNVTPEQTLWLEETKKIERELFPNGTPV